MGVRAGRPGRRKGKWATQGGGGGFDTGAENMCIGEAVCGRRFSVGVGWRDDDPRRQMTVQSQERWKGLAQRYGRHLLVVLVAVLLVHNVFGAHGFLAMHQKQQEIEKVKTEIERLNKENAALEGDVKDLKTDPQTIEKIAREELGQARPGEVIIKLPAAANESGAAAKTQ